MSFPAFDTELLLFINQNHNVFMDGIMIKFSETMTWALMLLVVLVVVFKNRPVKEACFILIGMALCIVFADQISSSIFKPWIARLRPTHEPDIMFMVRHISGRGGGYSFMSSHAANTFAMATFLSLLFRHRITTISLLVWASIVGFSRIYLGMHYPLDVLAGSLLGILVGMVVYKIFRLSLSLSGGLPQQYYSNAYTHSGFSCDDMYIILSSMAITLVYTMF